MPTAISAPPVPMTAPRGAEVVVAGKRCPIAGRISMDLTARRRHRSDKNAVRAAIWYADRRRHYGRELAHHFGTIGYEVLTSLGKRTRESTRAGNGLAEPCSLQRSRLPLQLVLRS